MMAWWGLAGLLGLLGVFGLVLVRRRRRERTSDGDPLARYPAAREPVIPNADAAHTPLMTPAITPQMLAVPAVPAVPAVRPPARPVPVPPRPVEPAPPVSGTITGEIAPDHPEPLAPVSPPEPLAAREDGAVKTAAPQKQATSHQQDEAEPVVPRQQTTSPYESRIDSVAPAEEAAPHEENARQEQSIVGAEEPLEECSSDDTEPASPRHFDPRAAVRLVIHKAKKVLRR
jgi:hypothetical protein